MENSNIYYEDEGDMDHLNGFLSDNEKALSTEGLSFTIKASSIFLSLKFMILRNTLITCGHHL